MNARKFILRDRTIVQRAQEFIGSVPLRPLYEVVVREHHEKRSLDANAYYWDQVVTPLAEHCGNTPEEMHEILLGKVFGYNNIVFAGGIYMIPRKRSSSMTRKEFHQYIEHCRVIAAQEGVASQPLTRGDDYGTT